MTINDAKQMTINDRMQMTMNNTGYNISENKSK